MRSSLPILVFCGIFATGCFDRSTTSSNFSGGDSSPPSSNPLPQVVELVPGGVGFASLSWAAVPGEQADFIVEGSTDDVTFVPVAIVPDGTTSATITSLATGATYYFRVRGYTTAGNSAPTPVVSASVP